MNRDNLLKMFHREKRVQRTAIYNQHKFFRNKLVDLIRQSKSNHYINFFDENLKNSKKIWNEINELISTKKMSNFANISLDVGGELTSNQEIIAESFNKYFTQIAVKIKSKLPPTNKSFRNYLDTPTRKSFFFSPTRPDEIMKIISSLDKKRQLDHIVSHLDYLVNCHLK